MYHGGTENTEEHGVSVVLCVLRASVVVFAHRNSRVSVLKTGLCRKAPYYL